MHRLALLVLLFAPAVGAQTLYTPLGQGSVGLSGVFAGSLSDDFGNDGATLGLTLSGGNAEGADASHGPSGRPREAAQSQRERR